MSRNRIALIWMVGVLFLSAALAWRDLGAREVLGQDENLTITKLDQPDLLAVLDATQMKATGQPGNMQPLYFLTQHLFWPLGGRSIFMFRFLPSVFGLLGVALAFKLGQVLFRSEVGLVGALLAALLPLHVHYSQIARPYTLLAMLSLASAYFLMRGLRTNHPLHWAGFVLTATLNFYTHYNSLFVLTAEGLFTTVVWLTMLVAVLRDREQASRLTGPALGFLVLGILCLPGLLRLLGLPWAETGGGKVRVELTAAFFYRFLYKIGLTTAWLRGLILGLAGLGLLETLYRRRWRAALLVGLWLTVPFVILAVMRSPRPFVERYVIFVPPVAFLLVGQGALAAGQVFSRLLRRWGAAGARWMTVAVLTIALALLFVTPLRMYYAANRAANRLDLTLTVLERHARPGDLVIVSPRFLVRPLHVDGAEVLYLTQHLSPTDFEQLLGHYQRTWVLYTSYLPAPEAQEPLDQWIQDRSGEFVRVPIKAITALAYHQQAPMDLEAAVVGRVAILEDLAEVSADDQEAWLRYEELATAYETLGQLYQSRGELALAAEYQAKAEKARAAAPRPW